MIATDLAQRYGEGEGLAPLAREYRMSARMVAKTLRAMGVILRPAGFGKPSAAFVAAQRAGKIRAREEGRARGTYCVRCQILLAAAPAGAAGICGWCTQEVR